MSGLRILQSNLGRKRIAHDMALATADAREADIVIVGEPNRAITDKRRWFRDFRGNVALLFNNNRE